MGATRGQGHDRRDVQDAIHDQDPILVETDATRGRGHNRWGTQDPLHSHKIPFRWNQPLLKVAVSIISPLETPL